MNWIKTKLKNAWDWTKRNVKKVLIGLGIVGVATAATIVSLPPQVPDIALVYKNNNMTIEFMKDNIVIGQALLKSHKTYDEVLEITSGKDRIVIWYEFSNFGSVKKNALKGVEFIDMKEEIVDESEFEPEGNYEPTLIPNPNYLLPIIKEYRFVYLKNNEWIPYNSSDIPKENIIIGVQTDLGWGEHLDVVLDVMENKLDRHALVIGTNVGFVTTAPVDDPAGTVIGIDNNAAVVGDTSPATAIKITEIGWWCDNATEAANFEVGLYAADGATVPGEAGTLLYVDRSNAKGTTAGWKRVAVDWNIDPSTDYWLGFQVDNTATATNTDYSVATTKGDGRSGVSTLPNPFGGGTYSTFLHRGIYAVVEVEEPPSRRIIIIE